MKKNIHVLYIITKLECGGAQKVCLALMHNLNNPHEHLTTSLISSTEGYFVESVKNLTNVYLLPSLERTFSLKNIGQELRAFFELWQTIKNIKRAHPNLIVHTHSTKAGILGRWAAWLAGVKKRVHTVHGYAFHQHQSFFAWWPIYLIELFTSFITTHFVCVSSADVKLGIKLFPHFATKHSIIRAAVEWKKFYLPACRSAYKHGDPFTIGTIACFKPQKNIFDLLKAFHYAFTQNPLMRLEIIGDGAQRPLIEDWIKGHHLTDAITLLGWQDNVLPFMQQWQLFALSSLWEGLPCAIVEARLQNLPVVAYDTGGIHDVVINHENGFLIKPKDWRSLGEKILSLSNNPHLLYRLTKNPDNLEEFKIEQMVQQHKALYTSLL